MGRLTEDICGKSFGKLTALKFAGYENNKAIWFCACSCGNFIVVRAGALKSGNTKSCGCYRSSFLVNWYKPTGKWYASTKLQIPDDLETWDQSLDYIEQHQDQLNPQWVDGDWFISITCVEQAEEDVRFFERLVKYPR